MKTTIQHVYDEVRETQKLLAEHSLMDTQNFEELKRILLGDGKALPGFATRLDRLEQEGKHQKRNHWALLTAFLAGFFGWVFSLFR